MADYWAEYDEIETDGDARHTSRFDFDPVTGRITQTLHDPDGNDEWRLVGQVDLITSRAESRLVASLIKIDRPGYQSVQAAFT